MRRIADRLLRLSPLVNCVFECCSTKAQKGATHPQSASHILSQVGTAFVMSAHKSGLKFWPAIAGDGKKNSAGLLRVLSRRRFPPQAARGVLAPRSCLAHPLLGVNVPLRCQLQTCLRCRRCASTLFHRARRRGISTFVCVVVLSGSIETAVAMARPRPKEDIQGLSVPRGPVAGHNTSLVTSFFHLPPIAGVSL